MAKILVFFEQTKPNEKDGDPGSLQITGQTTNPATVKDQMDRFKEKARDDVR